MGRPGESLVGGDDGASRSSAEVSDATRRAFEATVGILETYIAQGKVLARSSQREWTDGVLLPDYTCIEVPDPEVEAALMAEVESAQRSILGDSVYFVLSGDAARGPNPDDWYVYFDYSVPGLPGWHHADVWGYGWLLFWHKYSIVWTWWDGGAPISMVRFYLHDDYVDAWVPFGSNPYLLLTNTTGTGEVKSQALTGARIQFIGLDALHIDYYDSRISGGMYVYTGI